MLNKLLIWTIAAIRANTAENRNAKENIGCNGGYRRDKYTYYMRLRVGTVCKLVFDPYLRSSQSEPQDRKHGRPWRVYCACKRPRVLDGTHVRVELGTSVRLFFFFFTTNDLVWLANGLRVDCYSANRTHRRERRLCLKNRNEGEKRN